MGVTTIKLIDFIAGNVSGGPPAPVLEGMEQCPLTNLLGENVFSDYDFDMGQRHHCSTHHRMTTHMLPSKQNSKVVNKEKDC